jgi:hypothetical protein
MMTMKNFKNLVNSVKKEQYPDFSEEILRHYSCHNSKQASVEDFIYVSYSPGGVSGGSYHKNSDPQPYTNDDPIPEFDDFYELLMKINSKFSYLEVKKLEKLITRFEHEEREYYGNKTDYIIRYVNVNDLYNCITSL